MSYRATEDSRCICYRRNTEAKIEFVGGKRWSHRFFDSLKKQPRRKCTFQKVYIYVYTNIHIHTYLHVNIYQYLVVKKYRLFYNNSTFGFIIIHSNCFDTDSGGRMRNACTFTRPDRFLVKLRLDVLLCGFRGGGRIGGPSGDRAWRVVLLECEGLIAGLHIWSRPQPMAPPKRTQIINK